MVVNDGLLPYQGTPREVFQHGKELEDMGLGVPAPETKTLKKVHEKKAPRCSKIYIVPIQLAL